jgi:uncharacterized protein (DUF433 family)
MAFQSIPQRPVDWKAIVRLNPARSSYNADRVRSERDQGRFSRVADFATGLARMFDRITSDPEILGGKPIIPGIRIRVEIVLGWIASGATREQILSAYPHLHKEDIEQALGHAAEISKNEVLVSEPVGV